MRVLAAMSGGVDSSVAAARIEEYQPGDLILDAFAAMPTASSACCRLWPMALALFDAHC